MVTLQLLCETYKLQIQKLANDEEISATSSVDFPFTEAVAQSWIDKNVQNTPEELYFVVLNNEHPVGGCALKYINQEEHSAYLGYWIGRHFWGQGFGFEAAQLLRDYAFTTLERQLLHAMCLKDSNDRSARILRKIGFDLDISREGHVAGRHWGERFPGDVWLYYILSRERWLLMR